MKKAFKIMGMHCTSCALDIDGELEDTEGIKAANTNYARQEAVIEFDSRLITDNKIRKIIKDLGYEVSAS